jgi:serine/threonine-protein kinase
MPARLRWGRGRRSFGAFALLGLAAVLLESRTVAASTAADQAAAESLFTEAKRLADAGDFQDACPKFAESNRLDPGAGTLLNLGDCYERIGKLASAWGAFKEAQTTARSAGDANRQSEAARRAAALEARLSQLTVQVSPAARVPGLEVRRDGALLGEGQWGSPVPIDPGDHVLEATAPSHRPWSTHVVIGGPGLTTTEVPPLADGPSGFWSPRRAAGAAVGGAGLILLGVALGFGAAAKSDNSDSLAHCLPSAPNLCTGSGVALRNSAFSDATIATGTSIAGSVVLVAGLLTLVLPSPSARAGSVGGGAWVRPVLAPDGVHLVGEW